MDHFSHEHPLILNEVYIAKSGDVCCGCREEIMSCRSFVYTCSRTSSSGSTSTSTTDESCVKFLLHKSCAELPPTLEVESDDGEVANLKLYSSQSLNDLYGRLFECSICEINWSSWPSGFIYICSIDDETLCVCAICAKVYLEVMRSKKQPKLEQHFSHEHPLILNEVYIARKGDVCRGCMEEIVSCRSFVYSCTRCVKFLLHKSCAELPSTIKHPDDDHDDVSLYLYSSAHDLWPHDFKCSICGCESSWSGFIYASSDKTLHVCATCAMISLEEPIYQQHPAHPQHALKFVQRPSSFKCDACKVQVDDDNIRDLSYICTKCSHFWIHKSCADAPPSFQFQFHDKHPLQLSFSLPQVYQKFDQYCRFCGKQLLPREWLYYCPKCRFFAHFHCARSNGTKRLNIEDEIIYDSEVVHLPAADESSADQLAEKFVMAMSTTTTITTTNNCFRHWAHHQHDLQLMTTINELNQKHDHYKKNSIRQHLSHNS